MFFEINPCSKILKRIKNGHFAKAIVNQNGKNGLYSANNMLNDSDHIRIVQSKKKRGSKKLVIQTIVEEKEYNNFAKAI